MQAHHSRSKHVHIQVRKLLRLEAEDANDVEQSDQTADDSQSATEDAPSADKIANNAENVTEELIYVCKQRCLKLHGTSNLYHGLTCVFEAVKNSAQEETVRYSP